MIEAAAFFMSIHLEDRSEAPVGDVYASEHGVLQGGRRVMALPSVGDVLWFGSARVKITRWRVVRKEWGMTPNCDPTAIPVFVYVKATERTET